MDLLNNRIFRDKDGVQNWLLKRIISVTSRDSSSHLICVPILIPGVHPSGIVTPLSKTNAWKRVTNVRGDVLHKNLHIAGICYRKMDMLNVERRNVIRAGRGWNICPPENQNVREY